MDRDGEQGHPRGLPILRKRKLPAHFNDRSVAGRRVAAMVALRGSGSEGGHDKEEEVVQIAGQELINKQLVGKRHQMALMMYECLRLHYKREALDVLKTEFSVLLGNRSLPHIIGHVEGVRVGAHFPLRAQLWIVGLHNQSQRGIGWTVRSDIDMSVATREETGAKDKGIAWTVRADGMSVATSVVTGEKDQYIAGGEKVLYVGEGTSRSKDQLMERGNLALRNSVEVQNSVRVIRAHTTSGPDAYTYDGLYRVARERLLSYGRKVYLFELVREGGQPPLH